MYPFPWCVAVFLTLVPSAFAQSSGAGIWQQVAQQAAAAVGNFTCECPIRNATTDHCPACTQQGPCTRSGCSRGFVSEGHAHVESAACVWAEEKKCTCDGSQLQQGQTIACEKANSNQCANFRCIIKEAGKPDVVTLVACGS